MLTAASNPGQGPGHPGSGGTKVQGFPAGYLPGPTSGNPGGGQTLVFGHVGVLGSPQSPPSLQQQQQQQSANKQDQVQKVMIDQRRATGTSSPNLGTGAYSTNYVPQYTTCTTGNPTAGKPGGMQFAPWQFAPQVAWAGLQTPTLLTAAPNQIFIRGPTQQDMFIQSPQAIQTHNGKNTK